MKKNDLIKIIFLHLAIVLVFVLIDKTYFFFPSDQYLEDNFRANRADFERLITIIQEDNQLIRVSKNGELPDIAYQKNENIISKERLNEYQSLLNKVNVLNIRVDRDNKIDNSNFSKIEFLVYESKGWMLGMGGTYKYYIFTQQPPERLSDSLDKLKSSGNEGFAYKKISENWYFCLDIW